jgi:23S rRNA pseudouridine1911/1915/1917 synthase
MITQTTLTWVITDEEHHGERLDRFLAEQLVAGYSRTRLQQLLKNGHVCGNGKPLLRPAHRLHLGDTLTLQVPPALQLALQPEAIDLPIVWQDEHMVVVNKPAGMLTHPTSHQLTGTVVNALLHQCGPQLSGINGVLRPGIVHRLDKDTSGLLMVAKTDVAHKALSAQLQPFTPDRASRLYRAVVQGQFAALGQMGEITQPIGRHPQHRQRMAGTPTGKPCATQWQHVQALQPPLHLVQASLLTGRTHQIRVHFAWAGFPILGDPVYGSGLAAQRGWPVHRQLLQAYQLTVRHPVTQQVMVFSVPMDPDFAPFLADATLL